MVQVIDLAKGVKQCHHKALREFYGLCLSKGVAHYKRLEKVGCLICKLCPR